jgi:hypothetical protein
MLVSWNATLCRSIFTALSRTKLKSGLFSDTRAIILYIECIVSCYAHTFVMVGGGAFNQPVSFIYYDNDVVFRITYSTSFIIFTISLSLSPTALQPGVGLGLL